MRETDPDVIGLQEELDALRGELVAARSEMAEISSVVTGDIQEVRSSLNTFMDGLPIPTE